jgi:hypothetical protein
VCGSSSRLRAQFVRNPHIRNAYSTRKKVCIQSKLDTVNCYIKPDPGCIQTFVKRLYKTYADLARRYTGKSFPNDCSEVWPTVIIDSHGGDIRMNTLDANIGNGIGKVLCRYNWAAKDIQAGPNTTFINDKGISVLAKRDVSVKVGALIFTNAAGERWFTNAQD